MKPFSSKKNRQRRPIRALLVFLLIIISVYYLMSGVFIFFVHQPNELNSPAPDPQRFYGDDVGPDKAVIIEDRALSAVTRINLIENAHSSLKIAYYAVHDGLAADIFYASILEAADRGVEVELLFDGIFHNLKGRQHATYWALTAHPNISVRFYEPLNLFKPWTINNRLHDKLIIVDGTYTLLGGRNIGDKYYLENYHREVVEDRDVLVVKDQTMPTQASVSDDFNAYFSSLWNHQYTKERGSSVSRHRLKRAAEATQALLETLTQIRIKSPERFNQKIDWQAVAQPTRKITLITNPIERLNKNPMILKELIAIANQTEGSIILQSPYVIPTWQMNRYRTFEPLQATVEILTNSPAASPNYFAVAGYLNNRKTLVDESTTLFEYHSPGSIHAKSYLFDDRLSVIGSFNLDGRSSFLSTESMVVIDSIEVAASLKKSIESLQNQSIPYQNTGENKVAQREISWTKKVIIKLNRIILYPFDIFL
jgi:putative cardiolipin synthase